MKKNPKIAILGFGREGKAVFKYLKTVNPKLEISILDKKLDKNYLKNLNNFDTVYRSPGVPYNFPEIQKAIKAGVNFSSSTDLFFRSAKGKIIGVTGTKGKGTTSTLIYKILKNYHKDVRLVGNIGKPSVDFLPSLKKNSWTVFELSSFQLQDLKVSPNYAVILDIFPDHMDSHKNFREYLDAKSQIARHQKKTDSLFYFTDSKTGKYVASKSKAKKILVLTDNFKLFKSSDVKIPGEHNFKNVVMASAVALTLGIPKSIIIKTAKKYTGIIYRLQLVGEYRGIKIYNDSASTNPQTTIAAIKAFKESKIVIMGGKDKNLDYAPVAGILKKSNTKLVILFGENKSKINKSIKASGVKIKAVPDLKSALRIAIKDSLKNDVILFSPGAASFDMFKDYKDRGKTFNKLVKGL